MDTQIYLFLDFIGFKSYHLAEGNEVFPCHRTSVDGFDSGGHLQTIRIDFTIFSCGINNITYHRLVYRDT